MRNLAVCLIQIALLQFAWLMNSFAQQPVKFVKKPNEKKVDVVVGGKFFTAYSYPDNIEKPVLYPLQTASGILVTRGFPLNPRPNERTDHPHHIGMWFTYGDVNGLDFWNNSYAIPDSAKQKYGSIRHQQVVSAKDGEKNGKLSVTANWVDINGLVLLKEQTDFIFSGDATHRVIDRITKLTAGKDKVSLKDNKEGIMGIRVTRELEIPADKPEIFTDANGLPTKVAVINNEGVSGNFLTSEGKKGNDAWGTRGKWCLMYGRKTNQEVSIAVIDHPVNPGYPTYWHARGYGLFAANNLGQESLSNGKDKLNYSLEPGKSATFKYRIVITNGTTPSAEQLDKLSADFASQ